MQRSPYNLLQEIYSPDVWKVLVCCQMLNLTTRRQVDEVRHEFFRRWPSAIKASKADSAEMSSVIKTLGLSNKRSLSIIKMSKEFLGEWKEPSELHGIGQYGQDSYDIFIRHKYDIEHPSDKFLDRYIQWKTR